MAVFGLVFGSTTASSVSPNDVRYGVDIGSGVLGNLVLPVISDVRYGVGYGSLGTEFYGTLTSLATGGTSWQDARTDEFNDELNEWGTTLSVGPLASRCQKTPDRNKRLMGPHGYIVTVEATFDIFTEDWNRLSLGSRKQFTCGAYRYEIVPFNYDDADVTIQFTAERVK